MAFSENPDGIPNAICGKGFERTKRHSSHRPRLSLPRRLALAAEAGSNPKVKRVPDSGECALDRREQSNQYLRNPKPEALTTRSREASRPANFMLPAEHLHCLGDGPTDKRS